jgi:hypothetical protein
VDFDDARLDGDVLADRGVGAGAAAARLHDPAGLAPAAPTLLPVWAGLPLGLFDDLYSGQPFGSGIVLWSLTMLAMDVIDEKFLWRGFIQDWLTAAALLAAYVVLTAALAGLAAGYPCPSRSAAGAAHRPASSCGHARRRIARSHPPAPAQKAVT